MRLKPKHLALILAFTNACQVQPADSERSKRAPTSIEDGVTYTEDDFLRVDEYGVEFTVPSGWSGKIEEERFVLKPNSGEGIIILGATELSMDEAKQLATQSIDLGDGISSTPIGSPNVGLDTIRVNYDIQGGSFSNEPGSANDWDGYGMIVVGEYGISAVLLGLAPAQEIEGLFESMDDLGSSVQFTQPGNNADTEQGGSGDWAESLSGYRITWYHSASGYYERESFSLCANGEVTRVLDSSAVYTERTGSWTAYGPTSAGTLEVRLDNGDHGVYELTRDEDGSLYLDGARYYQEWEGC